MVHESQESTSEPFSAEKYFATQPPPPTLEEDVAQVRDFVQKQREAKRKVVLVTVRLVIFSSLAAVVDAPVSFCRAEGRRCPSN